MTKPDQIEHDVTQTRTSLAENVSQLSDKVSPSKYAGRRIDRMKDSAGSIKDKLMGASGDAASGASDKATSVADKASSAASSAKDAASAAPGMISDKTQGNPIAAGLIAFGVGWLLSSIAPATNAEKKTAKRVEDNAGGIVEPLKQSAQEVATNLQEPLQQSAEAVKSTATDAAADTADKAKSAAADVQEPLKK
jgi:hypothetical protein